MTSQTEVQYRCSGVQYILQVHCQQYSVAAVYTVHAVYLILPCEVYEHTAYILPSSCSVLVVYPAESGKCMRSIYCTSTALRSGMDKFFIRHFRNSKDMCGESITFRKLWSIACGFCHLDAFLKLCFDAVTET